ncbi:helix-turn-helix domain-containing protein [Pandoraea sputorum]|nr:helix-turn-helix transcriptional regulator [Pandoraea sputorum]
MMEIEKSTGNVYADVGAGDADEMLVKAQLVSNIAEIIAARDWTQQQAATVLGLPRPKLSHILRGQFRGVSEARLMECLAALGRDIQIVVGPARTTVGSIEVVFA